jgi:hypothetical protein
MYNDILGPKCAARLGDLRPGRVLPITCRQCRHTAKVSPAPLLKRFGQF